MKVIPITQHAALRRLELADAEEMFWLTDTNRLHLREWLPWLDIVTNVADTRRFISATLDQDSRRQGTHFGIWYNGRLTGTVGVHHIDWTNRKTSIGYWLGAQYTGHGLMTAAVSAYLDHLIFGEWDLQKVAIHAATENKKSRAIPERLGFKLEGILRSNEFLYDHYVDHAVYGMLASEWR
ncbi:MULTISPECIES: GNAT family N-acetyltransferase [Brevibacillus]|jgi:ribosomal-protein-serine acetyltransferase|uniref:Acetyltransferase n=1 Tax=Brevibacillus borstelensis AK1 TaxID=1300222 RepID=M8DUE8_9BACL|nr:GNAT family protein [Brevibacillus borstelensis]EMT50586.1 acetyltransferase [Brevibacillus borstelensis AK1]KKX56975.1 alanine acetyltransferase [Brevibacillus borstelensis cifa_chp40]MBE5395321.1 GNAT family N-acetyltransferase [Brevibacillus borstelensis]MCC0566366.1 GNAT family N-acetyltransferase [Brevibacillus borstelensis]MCM3471882.1 GNAT family N-acetyltransferase [Brevibacillus borstelensis]